jgi:hypothetical protein
MDFVLVTGLVHNFISVVVFKKAAMPDDRPRSLLGIEENRCHARIKLSEKL